MFDALFAQMLNCGSSMMVIVTAGCVWRKVGARERDEAFSNAINFTLRRQLAQL
jgi:hypothetical protein